MTNETSSVPTTSLVKHPDILMSVGVVAILMVMLIPLPRFFLDLLLSFNITLSIIILLVGMQVRRPLEFSVFPSILLMVTLLRLALNIASTRLILLHGNEGVAAAGEVIRAFGNFVVGGNYTVGLVVFTILVIINFVVITKGAGRVAEVAARFTLDAMPGKQMSIDADLNAGLINDKEARQRRKEIAQEADFYGAMDGASKFVRGDAIAAIIITFVNILGGLYVGMVEHGMPLMQSLEVYTKLTIGDGLASAVPAFVLSVGAGMLVTRSTAQSNMGEEVLGQLLAKPVALVLTSAFLGALMLTPLPKIPLLMLASGCGSLALFVSRSNRQKAAKVIQDSRAREQARPEKIESHLTVDALELQIGLGLVRIVDRARGGDLLDRIAAMRKQIAVELGLIVPPVRIRDNNQLEPNRYALLLRGQEIAAGDLYVDQFLAIDNGLAAQALPGLRTTEPAFGLAAWWILPADRDYAERHQYTVVEPTGVLATHLTEMIKRSAAELLTRADLHKLLDNLKQRNQALVEEVIPALLKPGDVQRVLQNLLRERVPIRDLETILETLGDWAPKTKDAEILTEYARNALARTICAQYRAQDGAIHCITLDPATEDYLQANIQRLDHGSHLAIPPERQTQLAERARSQLDQATTASGGAAVVVLCSPPVRMWVRRLLEPALPTTAVLGLNEIVRGVDLNAHGVVSLESRASVSRPVHA